MQSDELGELFSRLATQMHRNFRKPLVIFTPKSLLRAKEVMSRLDDMGLGTSFHRVIPEGDAVAADDRVRRVVLCSGKVYFDLLKAREKEATTGSPWSASSSSTRSRSMP